jgi:hypothetical protein
MNNRLPICPDCKAGCPACGGTGMREAPAKHTHTPGAVSAAAPFSWANHNWCLTARAAIQHAKGESK